MTTAGTWYPPSCGTGGFLIELTNPPFTMTNPTEPTTQTPELLLSKPPEVFAESLEVPSYSQRCEIARLAYDYFSRLARSTAYGARVPLPILLDPKGTSPRP